MSARENDGARKKGAGGLGAAISGAFPGILPGKMVRQDAEPCTLEACAPLGNLRAAAPLDQFYGRLRRSVPTGGGWAHVFSRRAPFILFFGGDASPQASDFSAHALPASRKSRTFIHRTPS